MDTSNNNLNIEIPDIVPILTLRNSVLFPGAIIPLDVGRSKSIKIIQNAVDTENPIIGIVAQKVEKTEDPQEDDIYEIGTAARILKVIKLSENNYSVIVQGVSRIKILGFLGREPYITAKVRELESENAFLDLDKEDLSNEEKEKKIALNALVQSIKTAARKVINLIPDVPNEANSLINSISKPGQLADLISANLDLTVEEKQNILEITDIEERLHEILVILNKQMKILKIKEKINAQVKEKMGKSQREYVLRQQLKAIQEELGEVDEVDSEINEFKEKIKSAGMLEEAEEMALKQIKRLKSINPASSEYSVTYNYVDWLVNLPWKEATKDNLDIVKVRKILDQDHYDLEKVKERILEYLAVRKLNPSKKGPILCLVGPPGVGKTSLGKSIARAMGRKFWRISLGGVRDEAEIRGHRRTYVGALPGRIIQGIKKVEVSNPVFMLDEIDKLGNDYRGDPASALLEVLDPEQNSTFSDHFLEVRYDLSKVMFIATANVSQTIPSALKDRMEILELPGYTRNEKYQIAKKYLIPRQIKSNGLNKKLIHFSKGSVYQIINYYTREAGVRNLERSVGKVCRQVAVKVAENKDLDSGDNFEKVNVTVYNLSEFLGPEKYFDTAADKYKSPGVATGLAWTPVGGDIIHLESRKMKGTGKLFLTGKLGDVMKESAQAALSILKSEAENLDLDPDIFEKIDIHLHVPAGAVPKDGPSAGITIYVSLLSLLSNKVVFSDVAMTGEITLRGKVLPVGGIKEKTLAAHRAGMKSIILPAKNKKDINEIPDEVKKDAKIHFVSHISELPKLTINSN
ncbi:MAG: endopeptidase La [Deltaproteobacteria bacterium]|jgi:ATP-dependent Lon protease|nr:endopeptidase La [Deltaproteobacteria bacterium]